MPKAVLMENVISSTIHLQPSSSSKWPDKLEEKEDIIKIPLDLLNRFWEELDFFQNQLCLLGPAAGITTLSGQGYDLFGLAEATWSLMPMSVEVQVGTTTPIKNYDDVLQTFKAFILSGMKTLIMQDKGQVPRELLIELNHRLHDLLDANDALSWLGLSL